jgi:hypothetical protein
VHGSNWPDWVFAADSFRLGHTAGPRA